MNHTSLFNEVGLIFGQGFLELLQLLEVSHHFFAVWIVVYLHSVSVDCREQMRNQESVSQSDFISKTVFSSCFCETLFNSCSSSLDPLKSELFSVDSSFCNSVEHSFALEWMDRRVDDFTKSPYFSSSNWVFGKHWVFRIDFLKILTNCNRLDNNSVIWKSESWIAFINCNLLGQG